MSYELPKYYSLKHDVLNNNLLFFFRGHLKLLKYIVELYIGRPLNLLVLFSFHIPVARIIPDYIVIGEMEFTQKLHNVGQKFVNVTMLVICIQNNNY